MYIYLRNHIQLSAPNLQPKEFLFQRRKKADILLLLTVDLKQVYNELSAVSKELHTIKPILLCGVANAIESHNNHKNE
jgi:hypothetical protein